MFMLSDFVFLCIMQGERQETIIRLRNYNKRYIFRTQCRYDR